MAGSSRRKPQKALTETSPRPVGRPTSFSPDYIPIARQLCLLGATDNDLATAFDVSEATINNWKVDYPEFLESVKDAKSELDEKVERSLFERATGYSHPAVKIFTTKEGGIVEAPYIEHYPPDATSLIFWLKNRQPKRWRDKIDHEHGLSASLEELLTASRD